ncbi:hypothetical protein Aduo_018156 [Ancylostoma duodenale]
MYDTVLAEHLKRGGRNARYSSKTIQIEVVAAGAKLIQKSMVDEVKFSKYFAVLTKEKSDVVRLEQLSISIRYLREEKGKAAVQGKFLTIVEVSECKGTILAELSTISTLLECLLDLIFLTCQSKDRG